MVRTEKITISLPKDDLRMIAGYESKIRLPRSALFKEAIELWLAVREKEEIRKRYMTVYADSSVKDKQLKRVEEMLPLALELWFDDLRLVKLTVKPERPGFKERTDASGPYFFWSVPPNGQALDYELQICAEGSKNPEYVYVGIKENYYQGPVLNPGKYSWKVKAYSGQVLLAESGPQPFEAVNAKEEFPLGIGGLPPEKARAAKISGFN